MTERNILFSIPTGATIEPQTMFVATALARRPDVTFAPILGSPIDVVRNGIVKLLLGDPTYTHLLMMDSDVVPALDVVDLLLECDWPMAAAIVPICVDNAIVGNVVVRDKDGDTHFITSWNMEGEPFEVAAAGCGCVLIRREVFEAIPWPWFKWTESFPTGREGEDIYFSRKAAEFGFTYKVHPKAVADHIKKFPLLHLVKAFDEYRKVYGELPSYAGTQSPAYEENS